MKDYVAAGSDRLAPCQNYTKWQILSYLLYGSIDVATQLQRKGSKLKLCATFHHFWQLERYDRDIQLRYKQAREEPIHPLSQACDSNGNLQIHPVEIQHFFQTVLTFISYMAGLLFVL